MMVKKINIKPYIVEVPTLDKEGKPIKKLIPYGVVQSIENVVLASGQMTSQQLSMAEVLRRDRIMVKIREQESKGFVLLEDADFNVIKQGFEAFKGFGVNEVELCKRIDEAKDEDVKVKEVKKKR